MRTTCWLLSAMVLLAMTPAAQADRAGGVNVELWTDRGNDAVYQPGDGMEVRVRSSDDGYLLVYEIDSEGYVRLLWPDHGSRGFVEGRQTMQVPSPQSNLELVVEQATGEGYLVALVSRDPFRDLPWYLRPYDEQAQGIGYEGEPDDEDGVTAQGQIVGDPFVAMERIRRTVLDDPEDEGAFGTAYTSYYVHERVRYPRYLCNDCHRPGYWAWWDGFDPYYASCSVFDCRVNWGWTWGPSYWFGTVPYYYYAVRNDCPPRYRMWSSHGSYSSWNGWRSWQNLMGGSIRRYKSPPPADYVPPSKYRDRDGKVPPGLLVGRDVAPGRHGGGLRSTDARWRERDSRSLFRGPSDRVGRTREVPRGGLLVRGRDRDDEGRALGGDSRLPMGRSERPREDPRQGIFRPRDRARANDREPGMILRGNGDRPREVGRWGQWPDRVDSRRDERPSFRTPPVERGRSEERWERREAPRIEPRFERREAPRWEPRERPHQEARPEPRQVEQRREDPPREARQERHSENRGGDRGRGGRPNR